MSSDRPAKVNAPPALVTTRLAKRSRRSNRSTLAPICGTPDEFVTTPVISPDNRGVVAAEDTEGGSNRNSQPATEATDLYVLTFIEHPPRWGWGSQPLPLGYRKLGRWC